MERFAPCVRNMALRVTNIAAPHENLITAACTPWLGMETATTANDVTCQQCGVYKSDGRVLEIGQGESCLPSSAAFFADPAEQVVQPTLSAGRTWKSSGRRAFFRFSGWKLKHTPVIPASSLAYRICSLSRVPK